MIEAPPSGNQFVACSLREDELTGAAQFRLLVLQSFSVLIAIISVALPIAFDYTYLTAFSTLSLVPTLFGTTSSPTGFVLLNAFVFVRWSGLALDLARKPSSDFLSCAC